MISENFRRHKAMVFGGMGAFAPMKRSAAAVQRFVNKSPIRVRCFGSARASAARLVKQGALRREWCHE